MRLGFALCDDPGMNLRRVRDTIAGRPIAIGVVTIQAHQLTIGDNVLTVPIQRTVTVRADVTVRGAMTIRPGVTVGCDVETEQVLDHVARRVPLVLTEECA